MTQDTTSIHKVVNQSISEAELLEAQKSWFESLIEISSVYAKSGHAEAKALAEKMIDTLYGYKFGAVLFKPTLATSPQTFRTTREGALSYFVGGDPQYPNDAGFAILGWTHYKMENAAMFISGNNASTMGKAHFTGPNGRVTTVDKTWGYVKDDNGDVRIILHHSSLEYIG